MAKKQEGYLSAKESRRISKENRRITDRYEKQRKRRRINLFHRSPPDIVTKFPFR